MFKRGGAGRNIQGRKGRPLIMGLAVAMVGIFIGMYSGSPLVVVLSILIGGVIMTKERNDHR